MRETVKHKIVIAYIDILQHKSYLDVSVSELCQKADVSRVSFYRNFAHFDELLNQTVEFVLEELLKNNLEGFIKGDKQGQKEFVYSLLESIKNYRTSIRYLLPENSVLLTDRLAKKVISYFHGENVAPETIYRITSDLGIVFSIISVWSKRDYAEDIAVVQNYILERLS